MLFFEFIKLKKKLCLIVYNKQTNKIFSIKFDFALNKVIYKEIMQFKTVQKDISKIKVFLFD